MNTDLPRWTEDDSRGLAKQIRLDREAQQRCIDAVQQDINAHIAAEDNIDDEPDDEYDTYTPPKPERLWWFLANDAFTWITATLASVLVVGSICVLIHAAVTR